MPSSEGRFKIWRISLCRPSPFPLNNNDQTTPSHKSTQSNTIITWVWLKTLYEVLHAVKQITTFTLMNEGIIFVSKMRVQKMPQRLYYESKKSCNFCKKWSLYYFKLKHRKVQKSISSRRFNNLYGHTKDWYKLVQTVESIQQIPR